jgi:ATP sulfurylase
LKQTPHGGKLVDLFLEDLKKRDAAIEACNLVIEVGDRGACDVELLGNGCSIPIHTIPKERTSISKRSCCGVRQQISVESCRGN